MKECSQCRRCYDDSHTVCPVDDKLLVASISCNVLISGRYLLEERLGKGGMGVVFKAKHKFLKSSHAIKLILPSLVEDDDALLIRFKQEAILAASIDHPNVIRVTDFGVEDEIMPYLVMEYVDGLPLSSYLVKGERMTPERAFELFQPIALGVAEAHRRGITHRDLKPQNIMVVKGLPLKRAIKVLDFGLAKIKSTESFGSMIQAETMSNVIGSPPYMSPEQWENNKVDHRTDIYGLGVILYQMLTGNLPFQGDSVPSIMYQHLTVEMPQFAAHGISLSPQLEAVVARALQKDREQRPDTIEEMLAEFEDALATIDVPMTVNIPAEQLKSSGQLPLPKNQETQSLSESQKQKLYSYFDSSAKPHLLVNEQLAQEFLNAQSRAEEAKKQIELSNVVLMELAQIQKTAQQEYDEALEAKRVIASDVRRHFETQLEGSSNFERQKAELEKLNSEVAAHAQAENHAEQLARIALETQRNAETEYQKAENQIRQPGIEEDVRRRAEVVAAQFAQQFADAKIRHRAAGQQAEYEAERRRLAEEKVKKVEADLLLSVAQNEESRRSAELEMSNQVRRQIAPFEKAVITAQQKIEESRQSAELEIEKRRQAETDKVRAEEEAGNLARKISNSRKQSGAEPAESSGNDLSSGFSSLQTQKSGSRDIGETVDNRAIQQIIPATETVFEVSHGTVSVNSGNSDKNISGFVNTDPIPKRKISLPVILSGLFAIFIVFAVGGYGIYRLVAPIPQTPEPNLPNKAEDKPDIKPTETLPETKTELVLIKSGTFQMGRNNVQPQDLDWGNQYPAHPVTVGDFYISQTEVSNAEYAVFMKATNHAAPGSWNNGKSPEAQEKMPVTFVSLKDAEDYADWVSKRDGKTCRLPTEAEWEFTARNGEQNTDFPWGNQWNDNLSNVATGKVAKVGTISDKTSIGGVEDLMGNVIEWTSSNYSLYPGHNGKLDPYDRKLYVIRGSSWGESQNRLESANLLVTRRQAVPADQKSPFLGFRIVCQP